MNAGKARAIVVAMVAGGRVRGKVPPLAETQLHLSHSLLRTVISRSSRPADDRQLSALQNTRGLYGPFVVMRHPISIRRHLLADLHRQ